VTDIRAIQKELRASRIDGWLFYDLLHRDPIAYGVLGLDKAMAKRRWFYLIPARGTPRKLVHRIEAGMLDGLPGKKQVYSSRGELVSGLGKLLDGQRVVAMQYSPRNNNPYVGLVDAGTVELVRSKRVKVVSSADLVQKFEARWSDAQVRSHMTAGRVIDRIVARAFSRTSDFLRRRRRLTEYDLQQWMWEQFDALGIVADGPAIVAAGRNSGNPHYEPNPKTTALIRPGDVLLIDIWGKTKDPRSVYYDITWTAFAGATIPERVNKIYQIVREARDAAIGFVQESFKEGREIQGWQVDRVCRDVIEKAGYGRWFTHRTGHNIGQEVHGNGASMDDLEMHDDRQVIPGTCFSIEPGIYLPEFGIRSEVDMYVGERGARVTGAVQTEMIALLAGQAKRGQGK
jgi:Xaa-Pro dipeptidase